MKVELRRIAQPQAKRLGRKHAAGAERLALPLDGGDDHAFGRLDSLQQLFGLCLSLRPETRYRPAHARQVARQG